MFAFNQHLYLAAHLSSLGLGVEQPGVGRPHTHAVPHPRLILSPAVPRHHEAGDSDNYYHNVTNIVRTLLFYVLPGH